MADTQTVQLSDFSLFGGEVDNSLWGYIFGPPRQKRELIELLRIIPAFEGLSANELITVERNLHIRNYKAKDIVFNEDMPGAALYIVKEGEVAIRKNVDNGNAMELAVIGERQFFGELALIDEIPRSASAVAKKDTTLIAFSKPDLDNIIERNPKLALKIIHNIARLVCKRLVKTNENMEQLQIELNSLKNKQ
jgi:CRP-like cAMP-binding protein